MSPGHPTQEQALRYASASKADKSSILDALCAQTGWHRDYARRALRNAKSGSPNGASESTARRNNQPVYSDDVTAALEVVWNRMGRPCGKRLAPMMASAVSEMEQAGDLSIEADVRTKLLSISAATIDRRLADARNRVSDEGDFPNDDLGTSRPPSKAIYSRLEKVIEVAEELASEGGYEAVQMREVAQRAGITLRTLYRYFPSKEELITVFATRRMVELHDDVLRRPPTKKTPEERAAAVFIRAFHAFMQNRGFAHAAMSNYHTPRPLNSPPRHLEWDIQRWFVGIAAIAAWGPDHAVTEAEYMGLFALDSVFASSVFMWLDGMMSAEYVHDRLTFAAARLLTDLDPESPPADHFPGAPR